MRWARSPSTACSRCRARGPVSAARRDRPTSIRLRSPYRVDDAHAGGIAEPVAGASWRVAAALGGVVGPAAFIGAWSIGAAVTNREYSSIDDAISRLAAVGADTRALMTAGFITFGVALPVYSLGVTPRRGRRGVDDRRRHRRRDAGGGGDPARSLCHGRHVARRRVPGSVTSRSPRPRSLAARPLWEQGHRVLARARRGSGCGGRCRARSHDDEPADGLVPTARSHGVGHLDRGVGARHCRRTTPSGPTSAAEL